LGSDGGIMYASEFNPPGTPEAPIVRPTIVSPAAQAGPIPNTGRVQGILGPPKGIQLVRPPPQPTETYCAYHPLSVLVCPVCIAALGGKTTAKRHSHSQLSKWGKLGGRPKKKTKKKSRRAKTPAKKKPGK
jgi:hypothetical protein